MSVIDQQHIDVAMAAADAARDITLGYFRQANGRALKSDDTPVTAADSECEAFLRDFLAGHFSGYGIVGEEDDEKQSDSPWQWIIDPIDGTKSFAAGNPLFGTLLALCYHGKVLMSIIDMPALHERWLGVVGRSTTYFYNGGQQRCQPSLETTLAKSRLYSTTPDMFDDQSVAGYANLSAQCQYRGFGGDCYNYALLASGHIELVCEADMKVVDFLPLCPVIEGAGGVITDWQGQALAHDSDGTILASANAHLHAKALTYLQAK